LDENVTTVFITSQSS